MIGAVDLTGYHLSFDAEMTDTRFFDYYFINKFNNGETTIAPNGELENYTSDSNINTAGSNYSLQNGELTITAQPTSPGSTSYTSGMLSTGYAFNQNQGYFAVRAQIPSTAGFWPAFWLLAAGPTDYSSEIDIEEQPNNIGTDTYFTSVKTPAQASFTYGTFNNVGVDLSLAYHTYGFMWTATSVQFTLDGQYIGFATATPPLLATLQMYLIENLAVGGWAGSPALGATAQLKIDYLRAYSNDPSVPSWWGGTITNGVQQISSPDPILVGGAGSSILALQVAEDAYQGDAQFTVSVDGQQIGGTQTATALNSAGEAKEFDVAGTFAPGSHTVTINFLNNVDGNSPSLDRNLYIKSASLNGSAVPWSTVTDDAGGKQSFTFQQAGDILTLAVSEDAYKGDAQYRVLVDGVDSGSTYIATASHATGAVNTQTITGNWGTGPHTVGVRFINDLYGGSPTADRNLYVDSISYDGAQISASTVVLLSNGTIPIVVPKTNSLALQLAEDAYDGDAQVSVTVDGNQVIRAGSVMASHAVGNKEVFTITSGLTAGTHDIGLSFLNDAYGGSPSLDRNLYLMGASLNGTALSSTIWSAALYSNGTFHFSLQVPS